MPRLIHWPVLLVTLVLAGCANLQAINPFDESRSPLTVAHKLVSSAYTPAERAALVKLVRTRYASNPTDENLLCAAVTYAVPGQPDASTTKVLALLDQLDTSRLSRHSQLVAEWLSSEMAYRESLEDDNKSMSEENRTLKDALARAKEKIEILTRIEQTIGPAPQLKTDVQGDKHE